MSVIKDGVFAELQREQPTKELDELYPVSHQQLDQEREQLTKELDPLTALLNILRDGPSGSNKKTSFSGSLSTVGFGETTQASDLIQKEAAARGKIFSELETTTSVEDFRELQFDNESILNIVKQPNLHNLRQTLQAKLEASLKALTSNPSDAAAKRILIETWTDLSKILEEDVIVPAYNTPDDGVRKAVFSVYHRVAKLLGRNTPGAVAADTKAMIASLGNRIAMQSTQGKRGELTAYQHIQKNIVPLVDSDMEPHVFVSSSYSLPIFKKFHDLICKQQSRGQFTGEYKAQPHKT